MTIPSRGQALPADWHDYVIEHRHYEDKIPLTLQLYVNEKGREKPPRALGVGQHPEHGLFLVEFLDGVGETFLGLWLHIEHFGLEV